MMSGWEGLDTKMFNFFVSNPQMNPLSPYNLNLPLFSTPSNTSISSESIASLIPSLDASLSNNSISLHPQRFSRKVFVGGLPADAPREHVEKIFSQFGPVLIDWPRQAQHPKERRAPRCSLNGYVFLVYQDEVSVHNLVNACTRDKDQLFFLISSATTKNKPAQVRPWSLSNIDYVAADARDKTGKLVNIDSRKTVFVGGVPRPTTAEELASILTREFGPVSYVGIDIDPDLKYPKGAARVAFKDLTSYLAAIRGRFVRIPHVDSNKKEVELKPYVLDSQQCDECEGTKCDGRSAPYFCSDLSCLQYYCTYCWDDMHYRTGSTRAAHCPLVRLGDQTKAMNIVPHHVIPASKQHMSGLVIERPIDPVPAVSLVPPALPTFSSGRPLLARKHY